MISTLEFDAKDYLKPYSLIETDLDTFERYFIDDFPNSLTRKNLFINYLRYIESFKNRVSHKFIQWINGSFISKKENPKDIDLVTFLDYEIFTAQEPFLDKYWCFSLELEKLDAYLVKDYPTNHPNYYLETLKFKDQWAKLYSGSREDEDGISHPKGFLQINFQ
jgi:hypothetical protein